MLPSPSSPLPQQSSPEEAPGRGTPALVHPERGMRQDSRHTQRGKLAVRTTHTGRRHSPGRTCGHVRRWICCYSQHTRAHMLTQACAQRERPQPSSSLPPPPAPVLKHTGPHRQMRMGLHGHTHRPAHTFQQHTLHQLRVEAALQPIWSTDPAGLSWSLAVGWGWGICPRG